MNSSAARAEPSFRYCSGSKTAVIRATCLQPPGPTSRDATADDALRSNCLFAVSLGLVTAKERNAWCRGRLHYLVVPGSVALTGAAARCSVPLPIHGPDGNPLNNPLRALLGPLRRRGGYAPQTGLSQRHRLDLDISLLL